MDSAYLNNHFLIAMPGLHDPNFSRGVTYICQHNESGALGITINRTTQFKVADVMQQLDISCTDITWGEQAVLMGGPVSSDRGFVLHQQGGTWDSSIPVSSELALTTSKDILKALAIGEGPKRALLALGYAGWGPGQLESEICENSWLHSPAENELIFDTPLDSRWTAAAQTLGVDIHAMTGFAGHA